MPILPSLLRPAPDPLPAHHSRPVSSRTGHAPAKPLHSMATPPAWIKRPVDYLKSLFDNHERAAKGITLLPHQAKPEPDPEILFMREACRKERLDLLGRHKDYTEFDLGLCMDTLSRDTSQQQIIQKEMESRTGRVRRDARWPQRETVKHAGSEKCKLGALSPIWNEATDFSRTTEMENKEFIRDCDRCVHGLRYSSYFQSQVR